MRWDEVTGGLLSSVSGCNGGGNGLAVTYFTLIDANSDREIMALSDQMVIDLATLPSNSLTIRANTRANAASVYLELDNGTYSRSENSAPFSLYGDGAGPNYQGAAFSLGTHKIRAIPYPSTGLGGTAGTALTVEFTVVDSRNNNRNFASTLVAQQSNKCMDVPASTTAPATQLQQWSCNATNAQNYQFEPVGTLKNTYRIKNRGNGLCLDIYGSDTADGAALIQYGCTGSRNQQFVLRPVENKAGTFQIVAAHSGKCIDVSGGGTSDGAKLIQWSCNTSLSQQWAMNGFVKSNTLLNGSFESQYSAWEQYAGSEQLSSDSADGGAALLLASAGSGVNQLVSVLPGRPYVLGVSMKGTDSNNGSSLLATYYDKNWNILQINYIPATVSSTYVRSKLYTVAPSNAAQLHLAFWKPNAGGNWFIDQVAVEQTGSTANQCSIDGGSSISNVRFTNNRSSSVVIQWVNQSCGEVTYKTLAPGQTWVTSTTVNHVWRVKDSATGNLLLEVTASA